MDHFKILKRAFGITWNYRVLWVFGILLALTTASPGGGSPGGGGGNGGGGFPPPGNFQPPQLPQGWAEGLIAAAIGLACLIFLFILIGVILRYTSETAMIRLVDQHEATGEEIGLRQGFRLGFSRPALRIFLVDLLFGLGGLVIFLLLMLLAAAPLLAWLTENEPLRIVGSVAAAGLILLVILLAILVAATLSLVTHFIRRAIVLEDLGAIEGIRRGFALVRQRLGDTVVMWIILIALGLAFAVLMIPVFIILVLAGVVIGGLPGLLVGWLASLASEGAAPWIAGAAIGIPIFLAVIILPAVFLSGLMEVFKSSTWTLTYRELIALETTT
jgi:hypothetical protein